MYKFLVVAILSESKKICKVSTVTHFNRTGLCLIIFYLTSVLKLSYAIGIIIPRMSVALEIFIFVLWYINFQYANKQINICYMHSSFRERLTKQHTV